MKWIGDSAMGGKWSEEAKKRAASKRAARKLARRLCEHKQTRQEDKTIPHVQSMVNRRIVCVDCGKEITRQAVITYIKYTYRLATTEVGNGGDWRGPLVVLSL